VFNPKPDISIYVHDIVICLIIIVGAFRIWKQRKEKRLIPTILIPIVWFLSSALVSLCINAGRISLPSLFQSSLYLLRFAVYAGVYVILVMERSNPALLMFGLYASGTALSIAGLFQYILYPNLRNLWYLGWDTHQYRLFSTLLDPNFSGLVIILTLFLGIFFWEQKKTKVLGVSLILNLISLYLTYSRGSVLAFIGGITAYIICRKQWKILVITIIFVVAFLFLPKPGGSTLLITRLDSTIARIGNWKKSIRIISRSPIVGFGFNTLRYVNHEKTPDPSTPVSKSVAGLDSSILFLLATTGIMGGVAFSWIVIKATCLYRQEKRLQTLRVIAISSAVSTFVHSLFTNSLFYPWIMIWWWVFLAASEITPAPVRQSAVGTEFRTKRFTFDT